MTDVASDLRGDISAAMEGAGGDPFSSGTGAAPEQQQADPVETFDPPTTWAAEEHDHWRKLPPEMQKILHSKWKSQEGDYTKKSQELAQYRRHYENVDRVLNQYRNVMAQNRLTPEIALQEYFTLADMAQRDPRQFIQHMAQTRGWNLQEIMQSFAPQEQGYVDPQVAALQREISQLKQGIGSQQQYLQQQMAYRQQQTLGEVQNEIQQFAAAKDEKGRAAHPYFEDQEVQDAMAMFVQRGASLKEAYDRAVYAVPSVRAKVLAAAKASEAQEARKVAQRAAVAGSSLPGSAPNPGTRANGAAGRGSIRDDIEAAMSELRGRA